MLPRWPSNTWEGGYLPLVIFPLVNPFGSLIVLNITLAWIPSTLTNVFLRQQKCISEAQDPPSCLSFFSEVLTCVQSILPSAWGTTHQGGWGQREKWTSIYPKPWNPHICKVTSVMIQASINPEYLYLSHHMPHPKWTGSLCFCMLISVNRYQSGINEGCALCHTQLHLQPPASVGCLSAE